MLLARRALYVVIAVTFAAIAALNLAMVTEASRGIGLVPLGVNGLSELRAVYVGVWLATATIFSIAAKRGADKSLHLVCTLLIGGQVFGRIVSLVIDGVPTVDILPIALAEAIGVVTLVILRPR